MKTTFFLMILGFVVSFSTLWWTVFRPWQQDLDRRWKALEERRKRLK